MSVASRDIAPKDVVAEFEADLEVLRLPTLVDIDSGALLKDLEER